MLYAAALFAKHFFNRRGPQGAQHRRAAQGLPKPGYATVCIGYHTCRRAHTYNIYKYSILTGIYTSHTCMCILANVCPGFCQSAHLFVKGTGKSKWRKVTSTISLRSPMKV